MAEPRVGVRGLLARAATATATIAVLLALVGCSATSGVDDAQVPPDPAGPSASTASPDGDQGGGGEVAVQDASLAAAADRAADAGATRPTGLSYERLGWSMPVDAVGVAADGQMDVPDDALRAGWYQFGPGAGAAAGTTVVAAHAGSYVTPRGPFWELTGAEAGDLVEVERDDGATVRYEVVGVETIAKDVIDLRPWFARDGDPRLVLITCGGVWDEEAQSYESNVVVSAVPVG